MVCGTWTRKGDERMVTWLAGRSRPDEPLEQQEALLTDVLDLVLHPSLPP